MDVAAVVLGCRITTSNLSRIWAYLGIYIFVNSPEQALPQIRRRDLISQKRDSGARAPTSFVAHLVAGLLAVPHDPWAARLSSTKHVGRPFLGSILGLLAVANHPRRS